MDLKTNNSNNNKSSIDNEKSTFERFESELKNSIFGVLFVLLKDEETSIYGSFLVGLIQFLQMLLFPFHSEVINLNIYYHFINTYFRSVQSGIHLQSFITLEMQ